MTPQVFRGIGVSPGVAIGRAVVIEARRPRAKREALEPTRLPAEVDRLRRALEDARRQIVEVQGRIAKEVGAQYGRIFDAHLLILEDRLLAEEAIAYIQSHHVNAEYAVQEVLEPVRQAFSRVEDGYLRERRSDVDDVGDRILRNLLGQRPTIQVERPGEAILFAHDLTPSDTATLQRDTILGVATETGGRTSHTAIMARSLEIPADGRHREHCAANQDRRYGHRGRAEGTVVIEPRPRAFRHYHDRKQRLQYFGSPSANWKTCRRRRRTAIGCGWRRTSSVPPSFPRPRPSGRRADRTVPKEFLYLNRPSLPMEEEHFDVYRGCGSGDRARPTIIRTLDFGGDKLPSAIRLATEDNPSLGLRAIRLCLHRARAVSQPDPGHPAGQRFGPLSIMYPMISGRGGGSRRQALLEEMKAELRAAGIAFDADIQMGAMIEIPSAAIIADLLAREVDFFSVGTNDLIQYALAIDRINEQVAYLYEPLHPAVLRMLRAVVSAAHNEGIWVSMCGEMAGDPLYSLLLVGLGFDELSMTPASIPLMKRMIRSITYGQAAGLAHQLFGCATAQEVEKLLRHEMRSRFPRVHLG